LSTFALLTVLAAAPRADRPQQPKSDDQLNRVLDGWQQRSSTRTSLDVRFNGTERDDIWHEQQLFAGRVLLSTKARCVLEIVKPDKVRKGTNTERMIWTNEAMHQIRPEHRDHVIWPIDVEDRGRLPAPLVLPFLWNVSADGLRSRYRVELLKEEAESWLLSIAPRSTAGSQWFSRTFLWLDRVTYLPRRYCVIAPDGKRSSDHRLTETRCDQPLPEEDMQIPDENGWHVTRMNESSVPYWLSQLIKFELLP
jgi:hypothetical protein